MTIIELFPWLLAICVALLSGALLTQRFGMTAKWAWIIALAAGALSFALYRLALSLLGRCLDWNEAKESKWQNAKRTYREFEQGKAYPAEKHLYYECLICGNAIPSMPKKNVSCKCRNITVDAISRLPTIQDAQKVKVFSLS